MPPVAPGTDQGDLSQVDPKDIDQSTSPLADVGNEGDPGGPTGPLSDATSANNADNLAPGEPNAFADDKGAEQPTEPAEEEFEIELPEDSPLTEEQFNNLMDYAESQNFTKEQAEKLIELQVQALGDGTKAANDRRSRELAEINKRTREDEEFGGEKFEESLKIMSLPVNQFGDKELRAFLKTPEGGHPAIARMLYKIGNAMKSDTFLGKGGGSEGNQTPSRLEKLYPSLFKNA